MAVTGVSDSKEILLSNCFPLSLAFKFGIFGSK
jgi:hypothetical protein